MLLNILFISFLYFLVLKKDKDKCYKEKRERKNLTKK